MRTRTLRRSLCVVAGALLVALGCGTAPKPVPVATGPAAAPSLLVDVARRCARIASCSDPHDPSNFRTAQACVDWWLVNARDESPLADCVMKAKTCVEVEACTHAPGDPGAESFCKAHPGTLSTCDGTRYISCEERDPRESTATECAALERFFQQRHALSHNEGIVDQLYLDRSGDRRLRRVAGRVGQPQSLRPA